MPALSYRYLAASTRESWAQWLPADDKQQGHKPGQSPDASGKPPQRVDGHQHAPPRAGAARAPAQASSRTDQRLSAPAVHALRQDQPSAHWHAGSASAVRRDGRAPHCHFTLAAAGPDWLGFPASTGQRMPRSSLALIRRSAGGCCFSLDPGAGLTAAPSQPPRGNCPTTPHPRLTSIFHLGSPLCPQVYYLKSRTAKHCLLADHLSGLG